LNFINKKNISIISYILIGIALLCSFYLAVQRVNIEKGYDQVEVMVNLTELESLANANDYSVEELALKFKDRGVTGVLVKEISLGDLVRTGKIQFYQGKEVKLSPYVNQLASNIPLADANIIITIVDKKYEEQIKEHLTYKLPGVQFFPGEITAAVVPVNLPNSDNEKELIYEDLKAIGVGFDYPLLKKITNTDINIIPQIRDWPKPTKESITFIAEEIKRIPNLSFILFNDKQVPGYPEKMMDLVEELKSSEGKVYAPIGIVEFFNQKGLTKLATLLNKETVRVHSIAANDMVNYDPQSAVERFELAVSERNIRALFVRFFDMDQPSTALEKNLSYIADLQESLENRGFSIGQVEQFKSPTYSRLLIGLIGLGVIAGGILVLVEKGWLRLSVVLGLLGILFWGALLLKNPILARKLMALASVIVYPTLAFLVITGAKGRNVKDSILSLIKMSAISWIGAIFTVGLLADKLFMLKLDQFVGVKAAHVLPLLFIPILIFIFNANPLKTVKNLLDQFISYRYVLLAGITLIALAIYVIRTGNEGTALVSSLEEQLRTGLKELLGVRPRTKEFLIGHPFTLLILYFGLSQKNWFLLLPAIIGQVSLVNTYAHIHTPLMISLIRSFHGLWIGIVLGIGLIYSAKLMRSIIEKFE
jgi:hypothetical protein